MQIEINKNKANAYKNEEVENARVLGINSHKKESWEKRKNQGIKGRSGC